MLIGLFEHLRRAGIPASLRELLDLIEALEQHLAFADMDAFYFLARSMLVKDERHFDRFDRAFAEYFQGQPEALSSDAPEPSLPPEWLRQEFERLLSEEEKARLSARGGLEALIEQFRQRLAQQNERHAGGNRWIGTSGACPFGSGGYFPEGIRVGEAGERQGKALKVWERREYQALDETVALGRRNLQMAVRRLRRFARQGAAQELDLAGTIEATAQDGGLLNIRLRPERHNAVKLLMLFDIGGSMDLHVKVCQELFSACRSEFKHLEYYYFHNFIYEALWRNDFRRMQEITPTEAVLRTYGADWKVIFVGDASMAPQEIMQAGGSIEHWNEEAGFVWMQRFLAHFRKVIWLNPHDEQSWSYSASTAIIHELLDGQMYPLTLAGLEQGMRQLAR